MARLEAGYIIRKDCQKTFHESREKACDSPESIWRAVRWARNRDPRLSILPTLVIPGSSPLKYETNPQAKVRLPQDKFFPSSTEADLSDLSNANYPPPIRADQITLMEVDQAIMRLASFKAPRPTFIPHIIFQHLAIILSPLLQRVFNASLELSYYAKLFRNWVTISMQKPHNDDYTLVKSYWPIALLDTIRKTLESILAKRISAIAEIHHLLPRT